MKTANTFMLGVTAGLIECIMDENDYNDWLVEVVNDGLKLTNKITKQNVTWNIYDYDCDFTIIKTKIEKFLKSQYNR